MSAIILTDEQVQHLRQAADTIEAVDQQGTLLGYLMPLHAGQAQAIAQAKANRRSGQPRIPGDQVQAHLRRLEEIRQREGMDEAKMLDLLRRMQAGEAV